MTELRCKGRIRVVKALGDVVVVGCTDGWLHVFEYGEEIWKEKISATYYRDPYTDVNILSVDVNRKYIAVGTDFMDGKVHVFSRDGERVWYRQFMTIVGCWERPDDVVAVAVDGDKIAVGIEWLNGHFYLFRARDGEQLYDREVDTLIRNVIVHPEVAIGTSRRLYLLQREMRMPVSEMQSDEEGLYVSNQDGVHRIVRGRVRWRYSAVYPAISASRNFVAAVSDELVLLSKKGGVQWKMKVKRPRCVKCTDDGTVYLGYEGLVRKVSNGEVVDELQIPGTPLLITEKFVCSTADGYTLNITEFL